jgi:tRNA-specific 2-thiouridylase
MLASLDPKHLIRISFPLGEQNKEVTRTEAERAGLAAARRPESQEACFLAGDDYRAFLGRRGLAPQGGAVVDEHGNELGRHEGYWRFTPGQRRGLGLTAPEPLYVLGTRPAANAVVVGPRESLARTRIEARGRLYNGAERVEAKLRYRSPAVTASVAPTARGFRLELDAPAYGVAPGQAAVLYAGDAVVGCGTVTSAHAD